MSQRKVAFVEDEYYHLYNRGNSKQVIFKDDSDYHRFQSLLYIANGDKAVSFRSAKRCDIYDFEKGDPLVHIGAYCLMPNHFHILVKPAVEGGIQKFMQKLATSYSMYFNKRYDRTGTLFEGKYKSKYVDSDEYLKYLFAYIHLNPLKTQSATDVDTNLSTSDFLAQYSYASLIDYVATQGKREEAQILSSIPFPQYYSSATEWQTSLEEWLQSQNQSDRGQT